MSVLLSVHHSLRSLIQIYINYRENNWSQIIRNYGFGYQNIISFNVPSLPKYSNFLRIKKIRCSTSKRLSSTEIQYWVLLVCTKSRARQPRLRRDQYSNLNPLFDKKNPTNLKRVYFKSMVEINCLLRSYASENKLYFPNVYLC